eukprot:2876076-Rhodomonas_salina.5
MVHHFNRCTGCRIAGCGRMRMRSDVTVGAALAHSPIVWIVRWAEKADRRLAAERQNRTKTG